MLLVLDTNVLVSGTFWNGSPATILRAWADNRIDLVASPKILWEYEEVLREMGSKGEKKEFIETWILSIQERLKLVVPEREVKICRDPDDDKFLSCALASKAMFLVSGDKDLRVLGRIGPTLILTPGQFVREHLTKS